MNLQLYSSSSKSKVDASLDTRFLTKEGRKQIIQDYKDMDKNMVIISKTLPDANSDNVIEKYLGIGLDIIGHVTGLPSNGNNGGLLGQIPGLTGVEDSLFGVYGNKDSNKVYMNGMLNSLKGAQQGARNIIDGDAALLYNPTRGFLADLLEASFDTTRIVVYDKTGLALPIQTGISKQFEQYRRDNPGKFYYLHSQANVIAGSAEINRNEKDKGKDKYASYGSPFLVKDLLPGILNTSKKKYFCK